MKVVVALAPGLGTMAANRSGLQMATLRNLLSAWVLTLPVSILMSALLFMLFIHL